MTEFLAEHRCHYVLVVRVDDLGTWSYWQAIADVPGHFEQVSNCPRCKRRLERRGLLIRDRDVRSEEARR